MKRSVILFVLLTVLAVSNVMGSAQNKTAEATPLYQGFLDPPHDFSLMPFWFWNGKMRGPIIQQEIRDMVDQHVYGAFLHARDGLETPYLSEDWWRPSARVSNSLRFQDLSLILWMSTTGPAGRREMSGCPAIIRARCWRNVPTCA